MSSTDHSIMSDHVLIAVMGATGSGKSTFINLVSGSDLPVGDGLMSCTSIVETSKIFEAFGRKIILIDTPGFDDTTRSDTDILTMIAASLSTMYERGCKLSGILYMHRISDVRMSGIGRRNFTMFRKLCGESTLKNIVIVTTMWSEVSPDKGAAREKELASKDVLFKPVLDKGAEMVRHHNTLISALTILQRIVNNHPIALKIQKELIDERKDIHQTDAGVELGHELAELARKHREELANVQREMQDAIEARDLETKAELDQVREELLAKVRRTDEEREKLASSYIEETRRYEEQMNELRETFKAQEEERAGYQAKIDCLEELLRQKQNESSSVLAALQQQIDELRSKMNHGCVVC